MKLSLSLESRRLEAASENLANINKTYSNSSDVPGEFYLKVNQLPNITDVVIGHTQSPDFLIEVDKSKKRAEYQSGNIEYRVDINLEEKVIDLNEAKNAYEASIRLFNNSKEISRNIMKIGGK
ncbi:hypothetical protein [Vibrio tetraodonis]|nr:hypothetical protein [Vibrio tetraodonis]